MGGGLLQLASTSKSQESFLIGNPQISFFESVYRKYTNFSMESIRLDVNGPTLSETSNTQLTCPILRDGDLISDIYFCFELPDIYSGQYSQSGSAPFYNYEFQWIKNIGCNIIETVSIFIGGNRIDRHYGEWLQIWSELNMETNEKKIFDNMTGNIPELYDPANGEGQNGIYPHITNSSSYTNQANKYTNQMTNIIEISNASKSITIPSIRKRKIKVPLLFWFNRNKGLALPLIALQYNSIEIKLVLKNVNKLFTVIETDNTLTFHKKRIKPGINTHTGIANFLLDSSMVNSGSTRTLNFFDIKPYVEGNYIFLDTDERTRFSQKEHNHLIEQVKRVDISGVVSSTRHTIELSQPVKYMAWVGRRSDANERNDWNNYTNWIYPKVPPYSNEYNYKTMFGSYTNSNPPYYTVSEATHKTNFRTEYLNKSILTNAALSFNGLFRIKSKDDDYFNNVQFYQHFKKNTLEDGIYVYSFSLNPDKFQPSGACNFSMINNIELTLDINELPKDSSSNNYYNYEFNIYTVNYNVLRIMSGTGGIQYNN